MSVERNIAQLEAWYAQYDDGSYRCESPNASHHELVRTAEALRDDGAIDWDDWLEPTRRTPAIMRRPGLPWARASVAEL